MFAFFQSIVRFLIVSVVVVTTTLTAPFRLSKPLISPQARQAVITITPSPTLTATPTPVVVMETQQEPLQTAPLNSPAEWPLVGGAANSNIILIPTMTPPPAVQSQQKIYPVTPMGDISSLPPNQQTQMIAIYNQFLQTPNLQYLTPSQQSTIFSQIAEAYLANYKVQLQQQLEQQQNKLNQLQQQLNQQSANDTLVQGKIEELGQKLSTIYHTPGLTMEVIQGQSQRAFQDWIQANPDVYSAILSNNSYKNSLNTILSAYGL